jgi:hypothetical protein
VRGGPPQSGLDALVFSAGIGEHDALTRAEVVDGSRWTGAILDPARNAQSEGLTSVDNSPVAVWVIPSDEEQLIARHSATIMQKNCQAILGKPGAKRTRGGSTPDCLRRRFARWPPPKKARTKSRPLLTAHLSHLLLDRCGAAGKNL